MDTVGIYVENHVGENRECFIWLRFVNRKLWEKGSLPQLRKDPLISEMCPLDESASHQDPRGARKGPASPAAGGTSARQPGLLASETFMWSRLTASTPSTIVFSKGPKHVLQQISAPILIMDMELTQDLSSSPEVSTESDQDLIEGTEHASLEDPVCHRYDCYFVAHVLPCRIITL